jgi:hypothetical protein
MGTIKPFEILAKSSSSDSSYAVRCYLEDNKISFFCSCHAGECRILCKHVRKIIAGDDSILFDRNQKNELEKIGNHLKKTQIPSLLLEIKKSEDFLIEAKRNVEKAKKNLEDVILNK